MNRRTKLRAQIALTTAVCFGSLATLAAGSPSRAGEPCEQPRLVPGCQLGGE